MFRRIADTVSSRTRRVYDSMCAGAGVWVMVIALLGGGLYYAQVRNFHETTECQARFNEASVEAFLIRNASLNARMDATDAVIGGVAELVLQPPTGSSGDDENDAEDDRRFAAIFQTYLKAVEVNKATREANPLPELPNC